MPVNRRHVKRQTLSTSVDGLGGASVATGSPTVTGSLILATDAPAVDSLTFPPVVTNTLTDSLTSSSSEASATPSMAAATAKNDSIALSTVIGACVGSFIGLALLIGLFIYCTRHASTKSRNMPRSPNAEHRNARGELDQERTRSGLWNKLDDEAMPPASRQMSQREIDEKNFPMFKKRSNSTRTTKTAKVFEEHGIDLPPLELSKYHPHLAEELALQSPDKPFVRRQESGVSWDGETVGDDSFLSLRSVRIESGAISPTMAMAKMTPPTMSPLHRWESAEVLSMETPPSMSMYSPSSSQAQLMNPFADQAGVDQAGADSADVSGDARDKRQSNVNPFFGSTDKDAYRMSRRGSRSNSRTRRSSSRDAHRAHTSMRATVVSHMSEGNPFEDLNYSAEPPPEALFREHERHDSVASGASGQVFSASHRAMESLIAALDLSKDEVEERLRVASLQSGPALRDSVMYDHDEMDIGIVRDFPPTPTTPTAPLTRL